MSNTVKSTSLKPGDVVQSSKFCIGRTSEKVDQSIIFIGAASRGKESLRTDIERGGASFLVTRIFQEERVEGGSGCDCMSPRCYHTSERNIQWVEALRLDDRGKVHGETIRFAAAVTTRDKHGHFDPVEAVDEVTLIVKDASVGGQSRFCGIH